MLWDYQENSYCGCWEVSTRSQSADRNLKDNRQSCLVGSEEEKSMKRRVLMEPMAEQECLWKRKARPLFPVKIVFSRCIGRV